MASWSSLGVRCPGGDGVIHGCYKTSNPAKGSLIAIDSAASCPNGHTRLNWNQTGPQGEQGPQGPRGESGPVTVSIVESGQPGKPFVTVDAESINQITLECPSGTVPTAANWFVNQHGDAGSMVMCRRVLLGQLSASGRGQSFSTTPGLCGNCRRASSMRRRGRAIESSPLNLLTGARPS